MNILILNGSPHSNGNTKALIEAFKEGAESERNTITEFDVCRKHIAGCLGCEYCHTRGNGTCVQKDDMHELLELLRDAEMLVLASPIYFFGFSAQLQAAIHRTYAIGIPKNLKAAAMLLSSGSDHVYDGAVFEYRKILEWMNLKDCGICTAHGSENKSAAKLAEARSIGEKVR